MKIGLFDWTAGGHHPLYLRRFAEALGGSHEVAAAAPARTLAEVSDLGLETYSLGEPRPREDPARPLRPQQRALAQAELDHLESAVHDMAPDHLIHLYADQVLRRWIRRPVLRVPTTIVFFYPRAHYPRVYGSSLSVYERLRGWFIEYLVARWRRRADAHAIFALDEEAVRGWSSRPGAEAHWLPEPPVPHLPEEPGMKRRGCVVWGTLSRHKGLDGLAQALSLEHTELDLKFAGTVQPEFEEELRGAIEQMGAAGVRVELDNGPHTELDGLRLLQRARCTVLPYPRHVGMSRVLLEACAVGTPVIVSDYGLIGRLVQDHGLGIVVPRGDRPALRRAVLALTKDPDASEAYREPLRHFASHYSADRFRAAVTRPFEDQRGALGTSGRVTVGAG